MSRFLHSLALLLMLAGPASIAAQDVEPLDAAASVDSSDPAVQTMPPASLPDASTPDEDPLAAYVDGAAQAFMLDKNLPGMTLSVVAPDRTRVLAGYGLADVESGTVVDPEASLFRIGSISKTFVWTAVMMLVDQGRLDLDADVNDYLLGVEIADTFDAPVTMRHLMTHTAGFEDSLKVFQPDDQDPRTLTEVLAVTQPERVYPPGERTSYSNWGSALAAQVVADIAGKSFVRVLDEDLLAPLGMRRTTIVAPSRLEPPLDALMAVGHEFAGGVHRPADAMQIGPFAPAGGIASTAADMARWMRFHLNGGELDGVRLLSPAAHATLFQRAFGDSDAVSGVAHGFQARSFKGIRLVGHGGSTGAFNSNMMLAPALGIGVFVSQNSGQGGYDAVGALTDLIIEREAGQQGIALLPGTAAEPLQLDDYVGAYLNNRRSFSTMTRAFAVNVTANVALGEDGTLRVSGRETFEYRPVAGAPDLFENARGARIRFLRDAEGQVVALQDSTGVHSHERVSGAQAPSTLLLFGIAAIVLAVTTLLGFWRRWKHVPERRVEGRRAALAAFVAAAMVLLYVVVGALAVASVSSMDAAGLQSYPPTAIRLFAWMGWGLAAAAALALFGLVPAWRGSRWGLWRRLHYSAFALVLAGLAWMLWRWNFYGAPYI